MTKLWIIFGTIVVGLFAILINIATNKDNNIIDVNFPPPVIQPQTITTIANSSWEFKHCTPTNTNCGKFE